MNVNGFRCVSPLPAMLYRFQLKVSQGFTAWKSGAKLVIFSEITRKRGSFYSQKRLYEVLNFLKTSLSRDKGRSTSADRPANSGQTRPLWWRAT
jgi:hypothetical protein